MYTFNLLYRLFNIKELCDNPIYECVTPLRCLLIKHINPNNWNVMQKMEKHTEVRISGDRMIFISLKSYYGLVNYDKVN